MTRQPARPLRGPGHLSERTWAADVCALTAYAALTAAMTWPLVLQLGAVVPKDLGDPLFSTWAVWWNSRVLPFTAAWWQGPIFVPAPDTLALADHRVGLSLLTTPLIWAGASPLAAYGVAFLASFVASAGAAYALCVSVGASRPAAFVGGLVFGFHPFRAAHLEHLELLSAYWLPLTLVGLHRWSRNHSRLALAGVTVTLVLQALTSGYYYFFSNVLLAGWVGWFAVRGTSWRHLAELAAALVAPLVVLAPILWWYRTTHAALGLSRTITEIEELSADIAGLVTPPDMLALWNTSQPVGHTEGALFPGITAVGLVVLAWLLRRSDDGAATASPRWLRLRLVLVGLALLVAIIVLIAAVTGPFAVRLGPLAISVGALYKPISLATLFALAWAATSPRLAQAWRRQSPATFYLLATLAMWALALGPTARLFGERVLYKAPYAWLMALPGFADAFRAPARFAMLAALTLGVAAALAFGRLTIGLGRRPRAALCALVAAGITLDGWIEPLPLPAPPPPAPVIAALPGDAVILEAPLGTFEDIAAMYRAMDHGRPLANGYSGYDPPHYAVLRAALAEGQTAVLASLIPDRDLAVVVAPTPDGARFAAAVLREVPTATRSRIVGRDVIAIPRGSARASGPVTDTPLAVRVLTVSTAPEDVRLALDGDVRTAWITPDPQAGGEQVQLDLGEPRLVTGLVLSLGRLAFAYPRQVLVEVSSDGVAWVEAWRGAAATAALQAALHAPSAVPLRSRSRPSSRATCASPRKAPRTTPGRSPRSPCSAAPAAEAHSRKPAIVAVTKLASVPAIIARIPSRARS